MRRSSRSVLGWSGALLLATSIFVLARSNCRSADPGSVTDASPHVAEAGAAPVGANPRSSSSTESAPADGGVAPPTGPAGIRVRVVRSSGEPVRLAAAVTPGEVQSSLDAVDARQPGDDVRVSAVPTLVAADGESAILSINPPAAGVVRLSPSAVLRLRNPAAGTMRYAADSGGFAFAGEVPAGRTVSVEIPAVQTTLVAESDDGLAAHALDPSPGQRIEITLWTTPVIDMVLADELMGCEIRASLVGSDASSPIEVSSDEHGRRRIRAPAGACIDVVAAEERGGQRRTGTLRVVVGASGHRPLAIPLHAHRTIRFRWEGVSPEERVRLLLARLAEPWMRPAASFAPIEASVAAAGCDCSVPPGRYSIRPEGPHPPIRVPRFVDVSTDDREIRMASDAGGPTCLVTAPLPELRTYRWDWRGDGAGSDWTASGVFSAGAASIPRRLAGRGGTITFLETGVPGQRVTGLLPSSAVSAPRMDLSGLLQLVGIRGLPRAADISLTVTGADGRTSSLGNMAAPGASSLAVIAQSIQRADCPDISTDPLPLRRVRDGWEVDASGAAQGPSGAVQVRVRIQDADGIGGLVRFEDERTMEDIPFDGEGRLARDLPSAVGSLEVIALGGCEVKTLSPARISAADVRGEVALHAAAFIEFDDDMLVAAPDVEPRGVALRAVLAARVAGPLPVDELRRMDANGTFARVPLAGAPWNRLPRIRVRFDP